METLYFGYDSGYRMTDSYSPQSGKHVYLPSVVSRYNGTMAINGNVQPGVLTQPAQGMGGHTAIRSGAEPSAARFANKDFTNEERTELSWRFQVLFFLSLRAHIPQEADTMTAHVGIGVPRAEYTIETDAYTGQRYAPVEKAFQNALIGEWPVQNEFGGICRVTIQSVLVKPQAELALWNQILRLNEVTGEFDAPDMSWMYDGASNGGGFQAEGSPVQTVTFDIGSYTSHAERQTVTNGTLIAVNPQSADIGMWTLLPDIERIVRQKTGANHLKPHQLMETFETGAYTGQPLQEEFRAMLKTHWPKYEELFRASFQNFSELDRVLLTGRGWLKFDQLFRSRWGREFTRHGVTIHSPTTPDGRIDYGGQVARGACLAAMAREQA